MAALAAGTESMADTPFESIESAHEYVGLLVTQVEDVARSLESDISEATAAGGGRHLDALRLVDYKLTQLQHHLQTSGRILNDLRALRRLLFAERERHGTSVTDLRRREAEDAVIR